MKSMKYMNLDSGLQNLFFFFNGFLLSNLISLIFIDHSPSLGARGPQGPQLEIHELPILIDGIEGRPAGGWNRLEPAGTGWNRMEPDGTVARYTHCLDSVG